MAGASTALADDSSYFVQHVTDRDKPGDVCLRILPTPMRTNSREPWQDLDGRGPFLVQRRLTGNGWKLYKVAALLTDEHIDKWPFRIVHVSVGSDFASSDAVVAPGKLADQRDLEYRPGTASTKETGHLGDDAMLRANLLTIAVAKDMPTIKEVWSAITDSIRTSRFRAEQWTKGVAQHVNRLVFQKGTPWPVRLFDGATPAAAVATGPNDDAAAGSGTEDIALSSSVLDAMWHSFCSIAPSSTALRSNSTASRPRFFGGPRSSVANSLRSLGSHRAAATTATNTPAAGELAELVRCRSVSIQSIQETPIRRTEGASSATSATAHWSSAGATAVVAGDGCLTILPQAARLHPPVPFTDHDDVPPAFSSAMAASRQLCVAQAANRPIVLFACGENEPVPCAYKLGNAGRGKWTAKSAGAAAPKAPPMTAHRLFAVDGRGHRYLVRGGVPDASATLISAVLEIHKYVENGSYEQLCREPMGTLEQVVDFRVTDAGRRLIVATTEPGVSCVVRVRVFDGSRRPLHLLRTWAIPLQDHDDVDSSLVALRASRDGDRIACLVELSPVSRLFTLSCRSEGPACAVALAQDVATAVADVAFCPSDNSLLILCTSGAILQQDSDAPVWNLRTSVPDQATASSLTVSPDGMTVYVLGEARAGGHILYAVNAPTHFQPRTVARVFDTLPPSSSSSRGHRGGVRNRARVFVSGPLLVAHSPGSIRLYSLYAASDFAQVSVDAASLLSKAVSPNGSVLAAVNRDGVLLAYTLRPDHRGSREVFRSHDSFSRGTLPARIGIGIADGGLQVECYFANKRHGEIQGVPIPLQLRPEERCYLRLPDSDGADTVEIHDLFKPQQAAWVPTRGAVSVGFVRHFPCAVVVFDDADAARSICDGAQLVGPHPHIVEVLGTMVRGSDLDATTPSSQPTNAVVFESMSCSLLDYLRSHRTDVTIEELVTIFAHVADALSFLHSAGRAHSSLSLRSIALKEVSPSVKESRWRSVKVQLAPPRCSTAARSDAGQAPVPSCVEQASSPNAAERLTPAVSIDEPPVVAKLTNTTAATEPEGQRTCAAVANNLELHDPFIAEGRINWQAKPPVLSPPTAADDVWALGKCIIAALHLVTSNDRAEFDTDTMQWLDDVEDSPICEDGRKIPGVVWEIATKCCVAADVHRPNASQVHCELQTLLKHGVFTGDIMPLPTVLPPGTAAPLPWNLLPPERRPDCFPTSGDPSGVSFSMVLPDVRVSSPLPQEHPMVKYLHTVAFPEAGSRVESLYGGIRGWELSLLLCRPSASNFALRRQHEADSLANNANIWALRPEHDHPPCEPRHAALSRLHRYYLDYRAHHLPPDVPQPRMVLAWRSVESPQVAYEMARDGPRALSTLDPGYFGQGVYFALEPTLAARYLNQAKHPNACLVLFAVWIAQPYAVTLPHDYAEPAADSAPAASAAETAAPVTPPPDAAAPAAETDPRAGYSKLYGGPIKARHDAHFIPVRYYGNQHPCAPPSSRARLPHNVDYQCADVTSSADDGPEGHELCVSNHNHVTPVAILTRPQHAARASC